MGPVKIVVFLGLTWGRIYTQGIYGIITKDIFLVANLHDAYTGWQN